jgi:hypothetical protein
VFRHLTVKDKAPRNFRVSERNDQVRPLKWPNYTGNLPFGNALS